MQGEYGLVALAALLVAWALDGMLGEPPARWHPVVWMGHYLGWAGRRLGVDAPPSSPDLKAFGLGALAWWVGSAIVLIVSCGLQGLAQQLPGIAAALLVGLALKPLLAWALLRDEVLAVEAALTQSLDAGRAQLARLVSRDVSQLSAVEVRESAIESLAENFNDSVVAPIFWFVLLGLPGAAVYRFANTADAMWGYRGIRNGQHWEWAGKWAARADDALSWIPARLSALLLAAVAGGLRWSTLRQEARRTPSPNSGWPMAAMALALGVSLRKPGVYTLHAAGRPAQAADTPGAASLASKAVLALIMGACGAITLIAYRSA
ncbi:MAG: adenosylcobinamide-phosphate synthase CbiB [Burkholderiaceae bacterium]